MPSNLTAFAYIQEGSEATPGLFNRIFSALSDNIQTSGSGVGLSVYSNVSTGFIYAAQGVAIGPGSYPPSDVTTAGLTIAVSSAQSDYIHFVDSSAARSNYVIGSRIGGTADGLNIWDASGDTMIASFSKQSIRFYQNVVGPVFDVGGSLTDTYNAATFGTGSQSTESRIQAAINAASAEGVARVYVPANMYPYSASSVSFIHTVQMVREGGDFSVCDVVAYGASSDGTVDDGPALRATYAGATVAGSRMVLGTGRHRIATSVADTAARGSAQCGLIWDGEVDVVGKGHRNTRIQIAGDFIGTRIYDSEGQFYQGFQIEVSHSTTTKDIIDLWFANKCTFYQIWAMGDVSGVTRRGGHGWRLRSGFGNTFGNCLARYCGGTGLHVEGLTGEPGIYTWTSLLLGFNALGCDIGLDMVDGNAWSGTGMIFQQNRIGARIKTGNNDFSMYLESNTSSDLHLTTTSYKNSIKLLNITGSGITNYLDEGTSNQVQDTAGFNAFFSPNIGGGVRRASGNGTELVLSGGASLNGNGAAARLFGGDAGTTGAGGLVDIQGGPGAGAGAKGDVRLQGGGGGVVVGATTAVPAGISVMAAADVVIGTTAPGTLTFGTAFSAGAVRAGSGDDKTALTTAALGALFSRKTTVTGGAGATSIKPSAGTEGVLYLVSGQSAGNRFVDLVLCVTSTTPVVVASNTGGTPANRTYSVAAEIFKVSLDGVAVYSVYVTGLGSSED